MKRKSLLILWATIGVSIAMGALYLSCKIIQVDRQISKMQGELFSKADLWKNEQVPGVHEEIAKLTSLTIRHLNQVSNAIQNVNVYLNGYSLDSTNLVSSLNEIRVRYDEETSRFDELKCTAGSIMEENWIRRCFTASRKKQIEKRTFSVHLDMKKTMQKIKEIHDRVEVLQHAYDDFLDKKEKTINDNQIAEEKRLRQGEALAKRQAELEEERRIVAKVKEITTPVYELILSADGTEKFDMSNAFDKAKRGSVFLFSIMNDVRAGAFDTTGVIETDLATGSRQFASESFAKNVDKMETASYGFSRAVTIIGYCRIYLFHVDRALAEIKEIPNKHQSIYKVHEDRLNNWHIELSGYYEEAKKIALSMMKDYQELADRTQDILARESANTAKSLYNRAISFDPAVVKSF